jgi:hypothetical protein
MDQNVGHSILDGQLKDGARLIAARNNTNAGPRSAITLEDFECRCVHMSDIESFSSLVEPCILSLVFLIVFAASCGAISTRSALATIFFPMR